MGLSALKTKDLFLSAFLISHDEVHLEEIEVEEGSRVVFSFLGTSSLDRLNREYHEGKATCNVHRFKESLQYLKDQMFTILRRKEERRYEHIKRGDRGRQRV